MRYMLISVLGINIRTRRFATLAEAREAMCGEMVETAHVSRDEVFDNAGNPMREAEGDLFVIEEFATSVDASIPDYGYAWSIVPIRDDTI